MTRNLKVLVLGLVAALALTAVAASSASAFTKFKADTGTTSFKGSVAGTFKTITNAGTIECTSGTFRGMVTSGSEPATIETSDSTAAAGETEAGKKGFEASGCTFFIFGVQIRNNGCQFRFHAPTGGTTGLVDIVNGGGACSTEGLTFEALGCKLHFRPQAGLSSVTYSNSGSGTGKSVKVQPNPISGITYTAEGCPSGNGTASNGVHGDSAVSGSSSFLLGGTTNTTNSMAVSGLSMV